MTKTVDSTGVADELTERYFTRRRYRRRRKELEQDGWEVVEEATEPWFGKQPFFPWADATVLSLVALPIYLLTRAVPSLRPRVFTVRYEYQRERSDDHASQ